VNGRFVPNEQARSDPQASEQQRVNWMTWREQKQLREANIDPAARAEGERVPGVEG